MLQTLKAETLAALPQLYQCRTLSKPLKTLIHKIDTIGVFYGLLSTKPENSRPRCAATHGHKFKVTCGFLIQICVNLRSILPKKMPPLDPSAHDLQNPKIASPKKLPYAPPCATIDLRWPMAKPLKTVQICPLYLKTDYTMIFYGLRSTKPKNFKTKEAATHPHAPLATSAFIASDSRAAMRHLTFQRYDITDDVILH